MKLNIKDTIVLYCHIISTVIISIMLISLYHIIIILISMYVAIINKFNLKDEDSLLNKIKRSFE